MVWVLKRPSNFWQINSEGKIADFGFKYGTEGFWEAGCTPPPKFYGRPGIYLHKQAVFSSGFSDSVRLFM